MLEARLHAARRPPILHYAIHFNGGLRTRKVVLGFIDIALHLVSGGQHDSWSELSSSGQCSWAAPMLTIGKSLYSTSYQANSRRAS